MNNTQNNLDELAAVLGGHEVTDEDGKIEETTSEESTATSEEKQPEYTDTNTSEKTEESSEPETHSEEEETEPNSVEDEKGRRYIPEKRFSKVYGKLKEYERKLKDLEGQSLLNNQQVIKPSISPVNVDKTDLIEIELLKGKLPQFDSDSDQYSPELDELGFKMYEASKDTSGKPTITRMEAARQALAYAKKFAGDVAKVQAEARAIKTVQSDQGITNRVINRGASNDAPGDDASPEALEAWLKANGAW